MSEVNTQIVTLTAEQITERVNKSNSFTKAEITTHRKAITKARKAKREKLHNLDSDEQTGLIAGLRKTYGVSKLHNVVTKQRADGRNYSVITLEQPKRDDAQVLREENEDLKARLAKLEALVSGTPAETSDAEAVNV